MLTFDIDKKNEFQFNMEITGDESGKTPIVEFRVKSSKVSLSFPAVKTGHLYEVAIDPLDGILTPGDYVCEVCVFLGDRYFVPVQEKMQLKPKLVPVVGEFKINEETPPEIKVESFQMKATPINEAKKITFKRKNVVSA